MLQEVNTSNHLLKPSSIYRRKIPLQVLCGMANSVLDGDNGDLLDYQNLIRQPRFWEAWGKSYGK